MLDFFVSNGIMISVGVAMGIVVLIKTALEAEKWLEVFMGITIIVFGLIPLSVKTSLPNGRPLTTIDAGSYTVVGITEVSKDKQLYYQIILEQEGEVRLYTLPKDMIDIERGASHPDTLTVISESGLTKATLSLKLIAETP